MTPASPTLAPQQALPPRGRMHLREVPSRPYDRPAIRRERLVARLASPGRARVALLSAPAGFGKTILLEQWAAADPRPVRWLDSADELLAAGLADQPQRPRVFVVDGGIPARPGALARAALAVPAGSMLVIAGRGAAPRAPARLWAEQAVLELGPRDLAMTHGEAEAVLRAAGVELSPEGAATLIDRLQGWPVAVALAARVLAASDDPEIAAASFGAREPHVAAYLREEVLADLPESVVSLVAPCSVADSLDPGLCEAIAPGATSAVQELERLGVHLAHPLVRDALMDDLDRHSPAAARKARGQAAAWFEEHGELDRAVGLLLGAGNIDRAATLMWQLAASHVWDEHSEQLDGWLASIPVARVEAHPVLASVAAAAELARGRFAHAARWTAHAESALATAPVRLARPARSRIGLLRALGAAGTPTLGDADMTRTDPWRSLACLVDGAGAALCGDVPRATERLEEGVRSGIVDAPGAAALCEAELALVALCAGDWAHGACLAERARGRIENVTLDSHATLALVVAVSAFARAHRGRFEEARADVALAHAVTEGADTLPGWYHAQLHLATARAELRLGAFARGRAELRAAARLADRITDAVALRAWIDDGWKWVDAAVANGLEGSDPLTAAELRVLRFLPTHLSFREVGTRLYVSANTVKTQAHAIYRKLGASSRSAAVERAAGAGLLDLNHDRA